MVNGQIGYRFEGALYVTVFKHQLRNVYLDLINLDF